MDKLIKRKFKDSLLLSLKTQANSSVTKTQGCQIKQRSRGAILSNPLNISKDINQNPVNDTYQSLKKLKSY